jgi:hypothetical protein
MDLRSAFESPTKIRGFFMKVGLELTTLHLHNMSLGLAAAYLENEANELTDHLEALLRSLQARGLPILKLCATMAQLHGNSETGVVGDDEEEEKDTWRAHFQQWVAEVELTTTACDGDEDDDDGSGDDDEADTEDDVDSDNNDDNDNDDEH